MKTTKRTLSRRVKGVTLRFDPITGLPTTTHSYNGPLQIAQKRVSRAAKHYDLLTRMSLPEREALQNIADRIAGNDTTFWEVQNDTNNTWEPMQTDHDTDTEEWASEGLDTTINDIIEELGGIVLSQSVRRYDGWTRQDRLLRFYAAWESLYPGMTEAYLQWDCLGPPAAGEDNARHNGLKVYEIFDSSEVRFPFDNNVPLLVCLVRHGFIGNAPIYPSCAFSIQMLELFRVLNSRAPGLSIFKFIRGICDLHKVPFPSHLRQQFSDAFDTYLQILTRVSNIIDAELQYNTPNWRLQNACPACMYDVEGESPLKYSMFLCMDGNNSLKRLPRAIREKNSDSQVLSTYNECMDPRRVSGDLYLTEEEVNTFSYEVKTRSTTLGRGEGSLPTDGIDESTPCVERWTNLAEESSKKMWGIFHETGIFTAICRHGMVLLLCDMVRSGELAKYPLALVDRLVDVLGPNLMIGYDIGCGFSTTARRSAKVGPKVISQNARFCVGSFHGHAHSRVCQIDWHPLYVEGCGLEDFEGCERVFSQSNALAGSTRHASTFHRQQAIVNYFMRWNNDKYAELSSFLINNYYQALNLIDSLSLQLGAAKDILNIPSDTVFHDWLQQEKEYITMLNKQPEADALHVDYITTYYKLWEAERALQNIAVEWNLTPAEHLHQSDFYSQSQRSTQQMEGPRLRAIDRVENHRQALNDIERKLGLTEPWSPNSPEWKNAEKLIEEQVYRQAINKLEKLVVSRLFELTKLNQSGTGVKLRTHIAKALKARSKAIKSAVDAYNQAASRLNPPRRSIDITTVLNYVYIGEFDLLRDSRQDIQDKPWTRPAEREALNAFFKLQRAQEEINRLNIEVRRVLTHMADEEHHLQTTAERVLPSQPLLTYQIGKRLKYLVAVNQIHRCHFHKLQLHPQYSGLYGVGRARRSVIPVDVQNESSRPSSSTISNDRNTGEPDGESDGEGEGEGDYDVRNEPLDATIDVLEQFDD